MGEEIGRGVVLDLQDSSAEGGDGGVLLTCFKSYVVEEKDR
jgi:hypothetical protein